MGSVTMRLRFLCLAYKHSVYEQRNVAYLFPGKNSKPTRTLPNNMSHISSFYLPPNDHCLIVTALKKSFNFLSFSGHPPKTGSFANFLSFDFFVRKSVYDILRIIILEKKGSSHIGQCNYPTFDATTYRHLLHDYRLSA